jgi:hypothetical protein
VLNDNSNGLSFLFGLSVFDFRCDVLFTDMIKKEGSTFWPILRLVSQLCCFTKLNIVPRIWDTVWYMAGGTSAVVLLSCNDLEAGYDESTDQDGVIRSTNNLYLHDIGLSHAKLFLEHEVICSATQSTQRTCDS